MLAQELIVSQCLPSIYRCYTYFSFQVGVLETTYKRKNTAGVSIVSCRGFESSCRARLLRELQELQISRSQSIFSTIPPSLVLRTIPAVRRHLEAAVISHLLAPHSAAILVDDFDPRFLQRSISKSNVCSRRCLAATS